MYKAPPSYGGPFTVRNGDPTVSVHAVAVDQNSTWLSTRKRRRPMIVGPFSSGTTYELTTEIPALTKYLRIWMWGQGKGSVSITASTDTYDAQFEFSNEPTSAGIFGVEAEWQFSGPPQNVIANGFDRELEVTWSKAPQSVRLTWTVTDDPGLTIWGVIVDPVFPAGVDLSL